MKAPFKMRRALLIFVIAFVSISFGQKIKIKEMNRDYLRRPNVVGFHYLHESMQEDSYQWIASVNLEFDTLYPTTLYDMYTKLQKKSNKLGANAFRVFESDVYSEGEGKYVKLGIYYLYKENRNENLNAFQGNQVYLFGFLGHHRNIDGYRVEINGERVLLEELRYKLLSPQIGDVIRIRLGKGIKAHEIEVKCEKDMLPKHFKFNIYKGAFSRCQISEHEWDFGQFLVRILKKEEMKHSASQ